MRHGRSSPALPLPSRVLTAYGNERIAATPSHDVAPPPALSAGVARRATMNSVRRCAVTAVVTCLPWAACHASADTPLHPSASTPQAGATAPIGSGGTPATLKQAPGISTDAPSGGAVMTAKQAMQRVLELIRTSKTIADFTPEHLEQVMKVPVKTWEKGYGFGETLTNAWGAGFDVGTWNGRRQFNFGFSPEPGLSPEAPSPPMTDICQVDFDQFKAALQTMGFKGDSVYDSPPHALPGQEHLLHGRWMYDGFVRPGMRVDVYPQGEHAPTQEEGIGRTCVKEIYIY